MIKYNYKLEDFEVVSTHGTYKTEATKDSLLPKYETVPLYKIYKLNQKGFFNKSRVRVFEPSTSKKTLEEVAKWLEVETGVKKDEILKELKDEQR